MNYPCKVIFFLLLFQVETVFACKDGFDQFDKKPLFAKSELNSHESVAPVPDLLFQELLQANSLAPQVMGFIVIALSYRTLVEFVKDPRFLLRLNESELSTAQLQEMMLTATRLHRAYKIDLGAEPLANDSEFRIPVSSFVALWSQEKIFTLAATIRVLSIEVPEAFELLKERRFKFDLNTLNSVVNRFLQMSLEKRALVFEQHLNILDGYVNTLIHNVEAKRLLVDFRLGISEKYIKNADEYRPPSFPHRQVMDIFLAQDQYQAISRQYVERVLGYYTQLQNFIVLPNGNRIYFDFDSIKRENIRPPRIIEGQ